MAQETHSGSLWNNAGAAGLVLGAVSAAYLFITQLLSGLDAAIWVMVINIILWTAKFIGCILLMIFFMKRYVKKYDIKDNGTVFKFGMATSLCSALIYAGATLANVLLINPDLIHTQMQAAMQVYSPILDSNSMSMLDNIEAMMPQLIFFSTLFYCFIYGLLLSAILSRNIPSRDPFANYNDPGKFEE